MKNIFAFTEFNYQPSFYPGYVSINKDDDGQFSISVRQRSDAAVQSARIVVSAETLEHLASAIMAFFGAQETADRPTATNAGDLPGWKTMETAPKDGTMLRLLVEFEDHATEDSAEPCPTIGANNFDHDGIDEWKFAGWNWEHDCFTQGIGRPVGWLPMVEGAGGRG